MMPPAGENDTGDYVLVCGFGRVGQAICELMTSRLVRYKAFDLDPYRVAKARDLGLPVFYGDARRPDVLQAFINEEGHSIAAVVVTLDNERDCTRAVRALRREYPTVSELPIFVRAADEKHRRKLASAGATALETGPQESALMLGGALLSTLGMPKQEVLSLIDDMRTTMFMDRMKVIGDLVQAGDTAATSSLLNKWTSRKSASEDIDDGADEGDKARQRASPPAAEGAPDAEDLPE